MDPGTVPKLMIATIAVRDRGIDLDFTDCEARMRSERVAAFDMPAYIPYYVRETAHRRGTAYTHSRYFVT